MHYASHILIHCIALWCAINSGETARSAVSPEILANFAKNVASVISPAILGDVQTRNNRSSLQPILVLPTTLNSDLDSPSTLDNVVDKTSKARAYNRQRSRSYPYNGLYDNSAERFEGASRASDGLNEPLRDESYLRQERPNLYERPYRTFSFSPSGNDNLEETRKPTIDGDIESTIGNIEDSSTNQYSSYHGGVGGFPKAAFPHGPLPGFHNFGPYGHFGYGHHSYGNNGNGGDSTGEGATSEQNNSTNRRGGYGPPYFGHGYHHPYFPYAGYDYYPHRENGNDSSANGQYGNYGHGPYHGGPDFYGPSNYGYNYGYNGNNNGGNAGGNGGATNSRQTEEPAGNGNQNNSTRNGYPHPYGHPFLVKPILGAFHLQGFPSPYSILPYDHFHFKGGPVGGVGHAGYPLFADPYPIGFPFHYPYGPFFNGKNNKYGPPNSGNRPSDTGGQTEAPAGDIMQDENPERITALNVEEVAPAPSTNQYKAQRKLKRIGLIDIESQKI